MKSEIRSVAILLLGTFALCYDEFDRAVRPEMCTLKWPTDEESRNNCTESRQEIVELPNKEAEANATLVCRDFKYIMLGHNSGSFVIERYSPEEVREDKRWIRPFVSNNSAWLGRLSPGKQYRYRLRRILEDGITKPYITEPLKTLPLTNGSLMKVENLSTLKFEADDSRKLKLEMSFSRSREHSCRYEAVLWDTSNTNINLDFDETTELRATFGNLEYGKQYTFEVWAATFGSIKPNKTSITFTTPTCLEFLKNSTLCGEEIVSDTENSVTKNVEETIDQTIRSTVGGGAPTGGKPYSVFLLFFISLLQFEYLT